MMIYLIAFLFACSVAAVVLVVGQMLPARSAAIHQRLMELERLGEGMFSPARQRQRHSRRQQLEALFQQLGERFDRGEDLSAIRRMLVQGGFRRPNAVSVYRGARIGLPLGLAAFALVLGPLVGYSGVLLAFALAVVGWTAPAFYVGNRLRKRQKELRMALPDALDAIVVCVEAGLGLNQAMVRVSDEIRHISVTMSDELALTNFEIRAGTPREEALRNLAERTGLEDIRSLVTMLIQTDRFGTSIAQGLRVQADTLREKRRQRAEEAGAKTTIKMLFPLVFFIFPAMWVVTLGPPLLQLLNSWQIQPVP